MRAGHAGAKRRRRGPPEGGSEDSGHQSGECVEAIIERMRAPELPATGVVEPPPPDSTPTSHAPSICRPSSSVRQYILAGDIFQANLSQRFEAPWPGDPFEFYRRLNDVNPAPFAVYFGGDGFAVASASPERFLSVDAEGNVETRPIKGTRRRGATPAEDRRLAEELLASAKDRAENVMIVDLLRNDLSKVCRARFGGGPGALRPGEPSDRSSPRVDRDRPPGAGRYSAVDLLRAVLSRRVDYRRAEGAGHGDPGRTRTGGPGRLLRHHRLAQRDRRHGHAASRSAP